MTVPRNSISRRRFLRTAAAGAAASVLPGCGPATTDTHSLVSFKPGEPLPWINWAANQTCNPSVRVAPASEAELVDVLRNAQGVVRAVGAGHSFSAVVPTDDTLISTDLLSGLVGHDPATHQARSGPARACTNSGRLLASVGQALPNMPDMDYLAMGGAIANSVHATGTGFGSMSSYVAGLTLATPSGELIECSADPQPRGIPGSTHVRRRTGHRHPLHAAKRAGVCPHRSDRVEKTEDVLADIDNRAPAPPLRIHAAAALRSVRHHRHRPGQARRRDGGQDDPQAINTLRRVFNAVRWLPGGSACTTSCRTGAGRRGRHHAHRPVLPGLPACARGALPRNGIHRARRGRSGVRARDSAHGAREEPSGLFPAGVPLHQGRRHLAVDV